MTLVSPPPHRTFAPTTGAAGARARVLVVDDDERNLLALSEVLHGLAEIVTAASGRAALRELLRGDFAVILLDVFMPGLDGYETAQLIRQRQQTSRIPIIFLSAVNKETEHLMRGYAMGAVDYVFKPVDPVVLQSKVSVFVDLHAMRLQVEAQGRAEQALRDANYRAELKRLEIERELQISMKRQAAILDALPIALYEETYGESDGEAGLPRRRFIGGDVEKLTGIDGQRLAADESLFHSLVHPDDRARVAEFLRHCEDDGHACEYRWVGPDGETRHFLDQRVPLEARHAGRGCAGTLVDVTEQKRLEAQLLQSGKLDAIGQLTGGIAHDFNNLLASILGGIQLLSRRVAFGESEARIVDLMQHAAQQGAELVRRMMAFARKQDLTPSTFSPVALRDSVAGLVEHALGGSIQFEWLCPNEVGALYVDRGQMELALVNLVLNARDAMPDGGTIKVEFSRLEPGAAPHGLDRAAGDYLRIAVSDSGHGIAPELLEKITEPFFTTKEAGKGTGLGLSMVFGFVRQSGGQLSATSEQGRGTTIELILPRGDEAPASAAAPAVSDGEARLSIRSVLLVDDDTAVRTIICEQLVDKGVNVCAVEDGASALARLEADPAAYDMLLTDFAMPGLNGIETIERARRISPGLRALLMTGFADERSLARLDPSIPLLRKPISFETLEAALA